MQHIFFDVDGVLIHGYHTKPEKRVCWDVHLERDFGIRREDFVRHFINGPFINEVLIGKRDLIDALDEVLPKIGYHGGGQSLADYWLKHDSNINTELFEAVKTIHASGQAKLYVVTNQEHHRARYLMNNLGFNKYFEDIYYAARIGSLKPNPDYFRFIDDALNLDEPPIFFDDSEKVVEGARNAGWHAYLYEDNSSLRRCEFVEDITTL